MKILLVTETLVTGGAETFVLRLAKALHDSVDNQVSVYVLRSEKFDHAMVRSIAPNIAIKVGHIPFLKLILKLDGLLFRLGSHFSMLRWLQTKMLRGYIVAVNADVVHSHLFTSDLVVSRATLPLAVPWVSTMHGDYLAFEKQSSSRAARIQDFGFALAEIEKSVSHMVCITAPQIEQLTRVLPRLAARKRFSKIYNGYAASGTTTASDVPEAIECIPSDAFVIGMVARGVRDKGWEVLIAAFLELHIPNSWLVLVGDGAYLQEIRPVLIGKRIIFAGNVVDPLRYINRFDVGCLPSRYKSESLPTVVIEYLYLGKPVIASNVGELPTMLNIDGDTPAGILIDLDSVEVMVKQMKAALQRIYDDRKLRKFFQENTLSAVLQFDMDRCVDEYLTVYESAQK